MKRFIIDEFLDGAGGGGRGAPAGRRSRGVSWHTELVSMSRLFNPMTMVNHHLLALNKNNKNNNGRGSAVRIGAFAILFIFAAWHLQPAKVDLPITSKVEVDKTSAKMISSLRKNFEKTCSHNNMSMDDETLGKKLDNHLAAIFTPPSNVTKLMMDDNNNNPVKPCMYTFIDLGANIGDSLGKFIDAGFLTNCLGLNRMKSRPRYDIEGGHMKLGKLEGNDLTSFANQCVMKEESRMPEDYCYVGVKGNPVFTKRLHELEARVMGTTPRPLRAAHFYTETIATGADGPTILHLDTVTIDQNFWGSSIYAKSTDVQRSKINGMTVQAPVMGWTLSTLLRRSVRRVEGAHVLIKMDIEGGEFPVMNEAIATLCNYTSSGVRVDLIMEMHDFLFKENKNDKEFVLFNKQTLAKLQECKINQAGLSGTGGQL